MSACKNPTCRRVLGDGVPRSSATTGFCAECGDLVYAFRPSSVQAGDWYFVSDGIFSDDWWLRLGTKPLVGGQCESCWEVTYRLRHVQRGLWEAECVSCGTRHPVRQKPGYQVIYPAADAIRSAL